MNHSLVKFRHMFGFIISLKDPLAPAIEFACARKKLLLQYLPVHGTIHFSINDVEFPIPWAVKQPHTMMLPPPC